MTALRFMRDRLPNEDREDRIAIFTEILETKDIRVLKAFLASRNYMRYSLFYYDDTICRDDMFYTIINELDRDDFAIEAFDAFIDDGTVLRMPYGMLAILGRTWSYAKPYFMILVSVIPDETWRQMATVLTTPANRDAFGLYSMDLRTVLAACLRWGRHAITPEQAVALNHLLIPHGYDRRNKLVEVTANIVEHYERRDGREWTDEYRDTLRARVTEARKRACYNDLRNILLGMINARPYLDSNSLLELSQFAVPCVAEGRMKRIEVVRMIDRIRAAAQRSEVSREQRNVARDIE